MCTKNRKYLYVAICVLIVNVLAFGGALNFNWTSPVFPKLATDAGTNPIGRPVTEEEMSWIGALLALGATVGAFAWGYLADRVGRKNTLLLLNLPFIVAYIVLALARTVELYYFARFLAGTALAGVYIIVPMYLVEISDKGIRGIVTSTLNAFVTLGMIFTYAVGPHLDVMPFTLVCLAFPLAFYVLAFIYLQETPFYLMKNRRNTGAALKSLMWFAGTKDPDVVAEELERLGTIVNANSETIGYRQIFRDVAVRRGLGISLILLIFQQCSGINVILLNTETIFLETKTDIPADTSSLFVGIVSFLFSLISTALVDKVGRKILLIVSGTGMFVSELSLGLYFYLLENGKDVSHILWLPIVSLLAFVGFYNVGFGPLPWVVLAETLPNDIKNKVTPIGPSVCCLLAFLITKLYSNMKGLLDLHGTFWVYTGFNVIALLFTVFVVPETKGKTLEEIQRLLGAV